ncbi:trimeric intracellular cation channel family protein [Pelosinus sp. IPA-1]|uniref:trimeric intracellular cation channel family protein n=1 Tax=Pelosinus sp. IPA-1 TaxID=3029569 RepID=UPI0024362B95|nr:trimeric intracellular cation channel family protein [Pelosinus sp. IPA-1]GMA98598.1 membrane protein [Pelosinus sp. IPA-1]
MSVLNLFEIIGTVAFAAAGALIGIEKKLDIFGVFMLALTTAVGGGIFRDMLIGVTPPTAFVFPLFTIISLITAIVVCVGYKWISKFNNIILICDAVGLGAFTAAGANLSITYEYHRLFITVTMAVLSGVGGGVIRDVFVRDIPFIFQKEVYAVASIVGAICFFYAKPSMQGNGAMYLCFLVTVCIRMICMRYDIHLPVIGTKSSKK